ncbi:tRNA (guanosine(18)-2'-O)-methyltransferase [bacterium BMS3Abin05]|nr:tRNA (guanosine(18)-2'-O)-methyltransferase [bacterium BMS3Abin05]GBE27251.1 tRNA (guanosine(18)-2'-O)-methyltransferase [bacterium BMS3Bbin03]HDZ12896.1 TrmH family RNA methyltransferase [Bacteroidota bacterium]
MRKLHFEEIKASRPSVEEIEREGRFPVSVVAENIRSLFNVGSIFRTSDGARIERLYLTGFTGQPPRNEIAKTALGAEQSVPWEHHRNTRELLRKLKAEGRQIVVLEHTDQSRNFKSIPFDFPLVLVIGNEVEGVTEEAVQIADQAIEIPMFGIKQSLNVSVAYGIAVYEIILQYLTRSR